MLSSICRCGVIYGTIDIIKIRIIIAIQYISAHMLEVPENVISKLQGKIEEKGLYFGDSDLIREIVVGLIKGNIILQGPPGTGKKLWQKLFAKFLM